LNILKQQAVSYISIEFLTQEILASIVLRKKAINNNRIQYFSPFLIDLQESFPYTTHKWLFITISFVSLFVIKRQVTV
jgi:hypothetical protein